MPGLAQVPDGHLLLSTFNYPGFPGSAGLYLVDAMAPHAVTPIAGLPPELTANCCGSAGANCVLRIPDSDLVAAGNGVLYGGTTKAFVLRVVGAAATVVASTTLGPVLADGGVHAIAALPGGDLLLGVGTIGSGAGANQPLLRWNTATGQLTPIPLPTPYPSGNLCNALAVDQAGSTAIVGLRRNTVGGSSMLFDLVAVSLSGGATTLIATLPAGEFTTQMAWACNGDLLVATARMPFRTQPGRVLALRGGPGGWSIVQTTTYPGLYDYNAIAVDPATCTTYLNPNDIPSPTFQSHLWSQAAGTASPNLLSTGGPTGWGLLGGVDTSPNPKTLQGGLDLTLSTASSFSQPVAPRSLGWRKML